MATGNLGKRLLMKSRNDQDETWMGRISTSPRYVTDITGPDLLSLVESGGG